MEKPNIEQYLDAKYVSDNPSKFDFRDVSQAREFCNGFERGVTHALQIAEQAVEEERGLLPNRNGLALTMRQHSLPNQNPNGAVMDVNKGIAVIIIIITSFALGGIVYSDSAKTEINRILNEPLVVESVTRTMERIDDNLSEEVFIWTVCNVKCYELKRKQNTAIGVELEVKR